MTGYCMGGALAIASAVLVPEVDAVVAFYGVPSPMLADPSNAKAPIQAHFGELDSFVGFSDITVCCFHHAVKQRKDDSVNELKRIVCFRLLKN